MSDGISELEKHELIQSTQKMIDDSIYWLFKEPVSKDVADYYTIITDPIDLSTILDKLKNDKYKKFVEWYNDIVKMFDNALLFNKDSPFIVTITQYLLEKFKNEYEIRALPSTKEWWERVSEQMNKIQKLFAESPVIQGYDPMISSIIKTSENKPPPNQHDIALIASQLGPKIQENEDIRRDVYMILKATEPNKITDKIDINALSASSQYALFSYLEAKL